MVNIIEKIPGNPAGISVRAYAKINLALAVLGKRQIDNYHEVAMIMQSVGLFDTIILKEKPSGIFLTVDNPALTFGEDNLVYRAAKLLKEHCQIKSGVEITLEKKIPLAAGLAGGSADAAATLLGLNRLWKLSLSLDELLHLGASLGSDVPFCLCGGTMLATGRGEKVTPLAPLPKCYAVLVKPPISVSTAWAYGNFQSAAKAAKCPDLTAMQECLLKGDLKGVAGKLGNMLEAVTIKAHPQIALLKKQMLELGAMNALMSGSGPTVFGLSETAEKAQDIAAHFLKKQDGCEVYAAEMIDHFEFDHEI